MRNRPVSTGAKTSETNVVQTNAATAARIFRPVVAPYNDGGPVLHAASLPLAAADVCNLFILETCGGATVTFIVGDPNVDQEPVSMGFDTFDSVTPFSEGGRFT